MNASINIYKFIRQNHGQDIIKKVRHYQKLKTRLTKLKTDKVYITSCKKEDLIPAFAKVNLSIKIGGQKLKEKVTKLVMDMEFSDKHYQIRKIRKKIRAIAISLKSSLGLILLNAVIYQVLVIRSRLKSLKKRHEKKPYNLRRQNINVNDSPVVIELIMHNFSSSTLSLDEHLAFIPNNSTRNTVKTQLELFYQELLKIFYIYQKNKLTIKTKLRRTYESYCSIHIPCKYKKVTERLTKQRYYNNGVRQR